MFLVIAHRNIRKISTHSTFVLCEAHGSAVSRIFAVLLVIGAKSDRDMQMLTLCDEFLPNCVESHRYSPGVFTRGRHKTASNSHNNEKLSRDEAGPLTVLV